MLHELLVAHMQSSARVRGPVAPCIRTHDRPDAIVLRYADVQSCLEQYVTYTSV
jgi:hypothetical protein